MSYTAVYLVLEGMVVKLCDTYAVEKTQRGEKVIILDSGAQISLAGKTLATNIFGRI